MAAISKTEIANLALSNIHAKSSVENIDTDTSTEAKQARLWYDRAREQALSAMDWGFARRRLTLTEHGDDPPAEWAYRYQYPADCIYFQHIDNPAGRQKPAIPYDIELADSDGVKTIITDQEEAVGVYTKNITDATLFSPDFTMALSFLLGYYMAGTITGKASIKSEMYNNYLQQIVVAGALSHNEAQHRPERDADWTDASVR